MLDAARLCTRALAEVAVAAFLFGVGAEFDRWIHERIAVAVARLAEEDREQERAAQPIVEPPHPFQDIARALRIDLAVARRASVAFHDLEREQRQVLRDAFVEHRSLEEIARRRSMTPSAVLARLKDGLVAMEEVMQGTLLDRLEGLDHGG